MTLAAAAAPVLPISLGHLHLHLWEKTIFVNQGQLHIRKSMHITSGTLTILFGTHRGVQLGVPVVTEVGHGSLPH